MSKSAKKNQKRRAAAAKKKAQATTTPLSGEDVTPVTIVRRRTPSPPPPSVDPITALKLQLEEAKYAKVQVDTSHRFVYHWTDIIIRLPTYPASKNMTVIFLHTSGTFDQSDLWLTPSISTHYCFLQFARPNYWSKHSRIISVKTRLPMCNSDFVIIDGKYHHILVAKTSHTLSLPLSAIC